MATLWAVLGVLTLCLSAIKASADDPAKAFLDDYDEIHHHSVVGDSWSGFTTTRIDGHVLKSLVLLDEDLSVSGARLRMIQHFALLFAAVLWGRAAL
jgi:hypothetical protein